MQKSRQSESWRHGRRSFGSGAFDRQMPRAEVQAPEEESEPVCVPLFISDADGEPDPGEYIVPLRTRRASSMSGKILAAVCAASVAAVLSAWFSSNAAREFFRASFADLIPAPLAAEPSAPARPVQPVAARSLQMAALEKQPGAATADANAGQGSSPVAGQSGMLNADPPHVSVPAAVEAPRPPPVVVHRLDPGEIAAALTRADSLIASGDLAAARLVLQRAAESEDARAAMKLAGTYDPEILSRLAMHGIVPDPAKAQEWYEKARKFGATEAAARLEDLAGRRR